MVLKNIVKVMQINPNMSKLSFQKNFPVFCKWEKISDITVAEALWWRYILMNILNLNEYI